MRILIFGAGAIGSLFGGLLSMEHDVTLVARAAHVKAINQRGLRITGHTTLVARPRSTTRVPDEVHDVVFITTKAYDTHAAVEALRGFWRRSLFVTLQNGLDNADRIAAHAARVVAGTTTHGVTLVGPGEIVHAGTGDTTVGPWKGVDARDVTRLADALGAAGIPTATVADVRPEVWTKAVVNAAINPLTAILRVPNGALVRHADLRALLERVACEGAEAARGAGLALDPSMLATRAVAVATQTAENRSSMLQDLERRRRTEIDAITGALLRAAPPSAALPYSRAVYEIVRGWETTVTTSR